MTTPDVNRVTDEELDELIDYAKRRGHIADHAAHIELRERRASEALLALQYSMIYTRNAPDDLSQMMARVLREMHAHTKGDHRESFTAAQLANALHLGYAQRVDGPLRALVRRGLVEIAVHRVLTGAKSYRITDDGESWCTFNNGGRP